MVNNMRTIFTVYSLLLAAVRAVGADISAEGSEGGEVSFQCSHRNAGNNKKYLCKNTCANRADILLSVTAGGRSESERITLTDSGNGVFTVTFRRLHLTDSGIYWCGVERIGLDTFTAVNLTVKEGFVGESTSSPPDPSPTWTHLYNHSSMQQTLNTSSSLNLTTVTALNSTDGGGQSTSSGTVLLTTLPAAAAAAVFTVLVLVAWWRKRRKSLKPQSQVCTSRTAPVRAPEQVGCERNHRNERIQTQVTSPENLSCTRDPVKDPAPAVITAEPTDLLHIYENLCYSRDAAHTGTGVREEDHTCSGIYINPLPSIRPEQAADGPVSNKNLTTSPSESGDPPNTRPRSLWFGLDLSGTI